ncbi:MurR/RpiR family transcriptional regulator [Streptobacillus felis]|uniref:MurR/RpiR family transcriptional regulator n=1 Tax=Streptobacillus felis TaxID=1384509 RepID=A0A7Z0TBE5_9FUSO|nr:MurR/RpiR family transcriptional regulator [Streptobacillus felis]NYV27293.1 MurR/RpiR family transcriptional regulator [Streptobacillus felis]
MSLLVKIRENKNFTSSETDISKYLMENYKKIKNLDAKKIASDTYTSISAVTRTCKKIGLSGFQEFKISLIEELANLEENKLEFENVDIERNNDTKMIIEKLNKLSISSLRETKLLQDAVMIDKVVDLIRSKKVIDFYGVGASHIVCLDAQYKFMRIGKVCNAFGPYDLQHIQAINSTSDNLAIIISYSGMTEDIVKISEVLKNRGIETISITKYGSNEVASRANHNLYVTSREALKRSAAIYSRISMLNLIDVIYLKYSNMNFDEVSTKINETKIKKIKEK